MGFCAIINRHRPDLLNFDDCDVDTPLENLELAFSVAEKELDIVRIVDPEDVCVPKPDDKAVLTYVSFLHHAFPDMPPPHWKKVGTIHVISGQYWCSIQFTLYMHDINVQCTCVLRHVVESGFCILLRSVLEACVLVLVASVVYHFLTLAWCSIVVVRTTLLVSMHPVCVCIRESI